MRRDFAELLKKELRLQRGVMMFALGIFLLGALGLWLARTNPAIVRGYVPADVQQTIMALVLLPVLIVILPVMIGSTAAAAEKPMGVLAWQSALPVARWQVVLVKCVVVASACILVAGLLPYILWPFLIDQEFYTTVFRGFWLGMLGLYFAAIGFFAGSHSRDDYQGLLVAIVPAVVVTAGLLVLHDMFARVFPMLMPVPLTRPWAVVVRFAAIILLLVVLASRMHIRMPQRRWLTMFASLALVFVVGVVLTWWNIHVEGTVLGKPKGDPGGEVTRLSATYPGRKVVPAVPVTTVKRGYIRHGGVEPTQLVSGKRVGFGVVALERADQHGESAISLILIGTDGDVREFPQYTGLGGAIQGVSQDQNWILAGSPQFPILAGQFGISFLPRVLPDFISKGILSRLDAFASIYEGWKLLPDAVIDERQDYEILGMRLLWKNGKAQMPPGSRVAPAWAGSVSEIVIAEVSAPDATTMTAVLRHGEKRGELELTGYVNGFVYGHSEDGLWVRDTGTSEPKFRQVAPWDEALTQPMIPKRIYNSPKTTSLPDGRTFVDWDTFGSIPVIEADSGPATFSYYAIVDSVIDSTQENVYMTTKTVQEAGVIIRDLETDTSTTVMLVQSNGGNGPTFQSFLLENRFSNNWHYASQTLAFVYNDFMMVDFSRYKNSSPDEIRKNVIMVPRHGDGYFLGERKFVQVDLNTIYLSKW